MSEHHGRGNPAFTREEVVDYLKSEGVAKSSEIAEEFDVSDVAVRKRLDKLSGIESRKIRNRLVWYVPHDQPESDKQALADGGWTASIANGLEQGVGRVGWDISGGYVNLGKRVAFELLNWELLLGLWFVFLSLYGVPDLIRWLLLGVMIILSVPFFSGVFIAWYFSKPENKVTVPDDTQQSAPREVEP